MRRKLLVIAATLSLSAGCGPEVEHVIIGEWQIEGANSTWHFLADGSFTVRGPEVDREGTYTVAGNELQFFPGGADAATGPRTMQVLRASKTEMRWCRSREMQKQCATLLRKD